MNPFYRLLRRGNCSFYPPFFCHILWIGLCFGVFCYLPSSTHAADIPGYPANLETHDAREIALLPSYCKHTLMFTINVPGGNNPVEIERWYSVMGPTFRHMHHYCWGLMKTNRAILLARNQQDRQFYLQQAIIEYDYVIDRAPENFILMPEFLTKKGENLLRLGRIPQGIAQLQRAIELKPDYWPPYAALSDQFKKTKDLAKAREWLKLGLSASPEASALQMRLAELDASKAPQTTLPNK